MIQRIKGLKAQIAELKILLHSTTGVAKKRMQEELENLESDLESIAKLPVMEDTFAIAEYRRMIY